MLRLIKLDVKEWIDFSKVGKRVFHLADDIPTVNSVEESIVVI